MKRQLALFSIYLALGACADAGQQVRPVFSVNNEAPRAVASDPYAQGKDDLAAGQYGLAVEQFMAAYRRNPYDVAALNALGITYDQLGRRDLAGRYLERALALDPSSPVTLNNLGRSRMNAGDYQMAMVYLQRAQALAGSEAQIASNLNAARSRAQTAPPAQAASRASPQIRIERESAFVQVLRTMPDAALPEPLEPGGQRHQSAEDAPSPASASLAAPPVEDRPGPAARPSGRTARDTAGALAVVNGTGRRGMASRFLALLARHGITATSLANADRYTYRTTTIFYPAGREEEAHRLAAVLPVPVTLVGGGGASPALRVRLGGDLMDFDASILAMRDTTRGML